MAEIEDSSSWQEIGDDEIQSLIEHIKGKTSFALDCYKLPCVKRCIARRISAVSEKNFAAYKALIMENRDELEALLSLITVEFSSFFRNREAFELLRDKVLREIIKSNRTSGNNLIRVWSAGCATGEEPYSASILFFELLAGILDRFTLRIFATDVDKFSVSKAMDGIYIGESLNELDTTTVHRYFEKKNNYYQIKGFIRKPVVFGVQDIINDPPISHLDLLICRNVLIYLSRASQSVVFDKFHYALERGGYLFLGKAETLPRNYETSFEVIDKRWKIYKKIK